MKRQISVPVVEVGILGPAGEFAWNLTFYGVPIEEFMLIPSPMVPRIRWALQRRGIDPDSVTISPFFIRHGKRIEPPSFLRTPKEEDIDWRGYAGLNA